MVSAPIARPPSSDESRPAAPPYPPGPTPAPDLVLVTTAYRLRVLLVLCSLFVFLAVYVGLLAGAGYLVIASLRLPAGWAMLVAIAGSAMLFLFLLKGLFKRRAPPTEHGRGEGGRSA